MTQQKHKYRVWYKDMGPAMCLLSGHVCRHRHWACGHNKANTDNCAFVSKWHQCVMSRTPTQNRATCAWSCHCVNTAVSHQHPPTSPLKCTEPRHKICILWENERPKPEAGGAERGPPRGAGRGGLLWAFWLELWSRRGKQRGWDWAL